MQQVAAPIAILGMHRSGTSCLAGSLEEAGLYLGDVNTKAPANARGNRENRDIMDLHDAVLAECGYRWDNPPSEQVGWSAKHFERLRALVSEYPTTRPWGFKDPRTLLLLDSWLEALPNLRLVASVRHPASVAASLRRRNKFSWEQGYSLWLDYNRHLLRWLEHIDFPVISFDLTPAQYKSALVNLLPQLGLTLPSGGIRFFSDNLRNDLPAEYPDLPISVAELYEQILSYSI